MKRETLEEVIGHLSPEQQERLRALAASKVGAPCRG
jgi:hypothetical protein